jgi:putative ABC transport system permease protein
MTWLMTSLRQLRVERTAAVGLATLVFVTAFVFAVAPRVLDVVADTALRDEVSAAPPAQRNLQLLEERRLNPDPSGPMAGVAAIGARYEAQFPPSLGSLIVGRSYLADTSRWKIVSDEAEEHFAILRFQPGVDDHIAVVEGRLPSGETTKTPGWADWPLDVPVFEVALAVPSAAEIGAKVGDIIRLTLDPTDRLNQNPTYVPPGSGDRVALRVVGLYRVPEPDADYWLGDMALAAPVLRNVSSEVQFFDVSPLMSPGAYDAFMNLTIERALPLRYTWRYYVDAARLDAERADDLVADLRRLESVFPSPERTTGAEGVSLRSGLLRITEAQRARWHSVEAVLGVVAVGPAAVAITSLALVVLLMERRRRPALVLQRGRGASTTQLSAAAAFEGLLLVGPAVAIAAALATWLVPTSPTIPTVIAALAVALVSLALLIGLTAPASRFARSGGRSDQRGRRSGARRLALEGLIVGLAVVGAILLRSRGVQGVGGSGALATPDPFIAAVPALLGLAAALIAMRLYPIVMRAVATLASLRRDLVPALALRQAARGGSGGPTLLVLLTTVALGAFSSATLVHLDRAADAVAWQETGAAFRLSGSGGGVLPSGLDTASLPGVEASAQATRLVAGYASRGIRISLFAIDVPAYQQVAAGTPMASPWPPELLGPATGQPIPVIVSSDLAEGPDAVSTGDVFELAVEGRLVSLRVVDVRPAFPSLAVGDPFAVVSMDQLHGVLPQIATAPTTVFLRAPDSAADGVSAALADWSASVTLLERTERAAELRSVPSVEAVTVGVAIAAIVALAYAGLAVAASLALSGAARASEVAVLRTLGLTGRQSFGLVVVEHGPTMIVAFVAGTLLGFGLFVVLRPGLGLGTVVGSPLDIPLSVDPGQLLLLFAAIAGIVAVSIGLAGAIQRSVAPVDALREGID